MPIPVAVRDLSPAMGRGPSSARPSTSEKSAAMPPSMRSVWPATRT